jgi:hypothetical protein
LGLTGDRGSSRDIDRFVVSRYQLVNVRFPDEIYEAIKSIAQKDGAKIHHRSGEIILTPTVVKLIRIGISHLSDAYQISLSDTHLSDNLTSRVVAKLARRLSSFEQELSDLKKLVITLSDRLPDKSIDKESDTISDKLPSVSNAKRAEAVEQTQPRQIATNAKKQKPEDEPDWVNNDNQRFYTKLINDPDLLAKVTESIDRHPKDNADLARSLVSIGFQKADGTALDSASMSRIKKVASQLQTP